MCDARAACGMAGVSGVWTLVVAAVLFRRPRLSAVHSHFQQFSANLIENVAGGQPVDMFVVSTRDQ